MTSLLDKLNLRPGERRVVVIAALLVMAFLYFLFIYPEFGEWKKLKAKKANLEMDLMRYRREISQRPTNEHKLALLKQKGTAIASDEQALDMQRTVNSLAALNGVQINNYNPRQDPSLTSGKTNSFFQEQTGLIQFAAEESALVNFLYALSSGNSLIRVSSMTVNPEPPNRYRLIGNMTLVASYPKKAPTKAAATTPAATPGPKPPAASMGPKSISAAISSSKPAVTNAPAKASWWDQAKSLFTPSKSTNASAKARLTTNAPPVKK